MDLHNKYLDQLSSVQINCLHLFVDAGVGAAIIRFSFTLSDLILFYLCTIKFSKYCGNNLQSSETCVMEDLGLVSEMHRSSRSSRRHGMQPTSAKFLPEPLSALLEFTGLMRGQSHQVHSDQGVAMSTGFVGQNPESERRGDCGAEVSIRIFGLG